MLNVTKTYIPPLEQYVSYLKDIWSSGQLTNNGNLTRKLQNSLIDKLRVSNLELVSNGTMALQLAIKSLELTGEIITTPFSYVATTTSIIWQNCNPVFVDIEENSFCINPDLIEKAITDKTSAILATHVYGYPCDVDKIKSIADKYNLKVIYDAAHAFGVRYKNKSLLEYGDISVLSFHATKLFHTAEGGAIISENKQVMDNISLLKSFGHMGEDNYINSGINAKMSELHAAMGLCVIDMVDDLIKHRKICSEEYDSYFKDNNELRRPKVEPNIEYNYSYYPLLFSTNEIMLKVRDKLIDNNIYPRRYFYPSLNKLPYIENKFQCPISEDISSRILALPLSGELKISDVKKVANIIIEGIK